MTVISPNRRQLKREHAQAIIGLDNYRELLDRIKHFDQLKEAAADKHREATEPIQAQLRQADEDAVSRVVDRLPVDTAADQRRMNLVSQLEECNVALQAAIADADARALPHRRELARLSMDMPSAEVIEASLYRTGDPEKVARCEALRWVADELQRCHKAAQEQLDKVESHRKYVDAGRSTATLEDVERRSKQWRTTLEVLSDFRDDARNEATTLREEIIDG